MHRLIEGGIDRHPMGVLIPVNILKPQGKNCFACLLIHSKGTPSTELALCLFLPVNVGGF